MNKQSYIEPEYIQIPEGSFLMGSKNGSSNEAPIHTVWVDSFAIGKYPVTNREYALFIKMKAYPPPPFWNKPNFSTPDHPVVGTSWYDAITYCNWLKELTEKPYRLPTEAEREKAARGGMKGCEYSWGNKFPRNHLGGRNAYLTIKGTEGKNGYNLYNMSEGIHEWCADWYDPNYYDISPNRNPNGPKRGARRVARGGSWRHLIRFTRCAARSSLAPEKQFSDFGFRCAMNIY